MRRLDPTALERLYRAVTLAYRSRTVESRHGPLETTAWIHIAVSELERIDDACADLMTGDEHAVEKLVSISRDETRLEDVPADPQGEERALHAARFELVDAAAIAEAIRRLRSEQMTEQADKLVAFAARRAAGLNVAFDAAERHLAGWSSARRVNTRLKELSPFEVHGHHGGGHGHGDDDGHDNDNGHDHEHAPEHGQGHEHGTDGHGHPEDCGCVDHEQLTVAYARMWFRLADGGAVEAADVLSREAAELAAGDGGGNGAPTRQRSTASAVTFTEREAAPAEPLVAGATGLTLTPCSPRVPVKEDIHVWVTLTGGPRDDATVVEVDPAPRVPPPEAPFRIRPRELEALATVEGHSETPGPVEIRASATIDGQTHAATVTVEVVPEYEPPEPHEGGRWELAHVEAHEQVDACTLARRLDQWAGRVRGHSGAVLTRAYNAGVVGTQLCIRGVKNKGGGLWALPSVACVVAAVGLGLVKFLAGMGVLFVGMALSLLAQLVRLPCRLLRVGTRDEVTSRLRVVGIHAALLRTGKVLLTAYDEGVFPVDRDHPADGSAVADSDRGLGAVWDPVTGRADYTPSLRRNKFCAHHSFLPDGRLFVCSGQFPLPGLLKKLIPPRLLAPGGDRDIELFDPVSETWTRQQDLAKGRWYPTCVSLADGRVFMASGTNGYATTPGFGRGLQNTYEYADSNGRVGSPIETPFGWQHLYPFGLVLPSEHVFTHAKRTTRLLDPRTGEWTRIAPAVEFEAKPGDTLWPYSRSGPGPGTFVLLPLRPERRDGQWVYPAGRVMIVGGGGAESSPEPEVVGEDYKLHHDTPATRTAEILDLGEDPPRWRWAGEHMANGHVMSDSVLLPDGTVLMVGGGRFGKSGGLLAHFASVEREGMPDKGALDPILEPELFDPETETWRRLARKPVGRLYHTSAILLADGRVLSAGHDGALNMVPYDSSQYDLEIFSPPYLFRPDGSPAPRPVIASAPEEIRYGEEFELRVDGTVREAALMRPSAVTHQINTEQRWVGLGLTPGASDGAIVAAAPGPRGVAPPGWYMLFVVNDDGTPSVAHWLRLH